MHERATRDVFLSEAQQKNLTPFKPHSDQLIDFDDTANTRACLAFAPFIETLSNELIAANRVFAYL